MAMMPSTQWFFRPSQMKEEIFLKIFTDRNDEIQQITSHIDDYLTKGEHIPGAKKNLFILGPRGVGKTSLLFYIKIRFHREEQHKLKTIIPIFFNEREDFNSAVSLIRRIYEIVMEDDILFRELVDAQDWKASYSKIKYDGDAFEILINSIKKEGKRLVLFIENFDVHIYQLLRLKGEKKKKEKDDPEKFQPLSQELFGKMVEEPHIMLICTGLVKKPLTRYDYGKETFKVIELQPVKDLTELFLNRIRCDNTIFLLSHREKLTNKIKMFEYLTEGNTRLMVQVYELLSYRGFSGLDTLLDDIIDKATPLFEWHLEKFIDFKSQEILSLIVQRDGNATIREIANGIDSSESIVRTLLGRLKEKNILEKIAEKRNQSDIYVIKSIMFFLWYQKCVLQKKDGLTDFFIHFIECFFDHIEPEFRRESEIPYRPKEDYQDDFITDVNNVKRYIDAGRFPLRVPGEKKDPEFIESEIEKLIYEVVKARKDDSILKEKIKEANLLKTGKEFAEAANLYRIIARGYLILAGSTYQDQANYKKAEENIMNAVEIYGLIKENPLEHVRCLMMLVEILSEDDKKRGNEIAIFTGEIIKIGKYSESDAFIPYIGYAYKHLGFSKSDPKEKLEMFQEAMEYFEKGGNYKKQTVIILVNMGLVYKRLKKYEIALNYFEKAFELSRKEKISDYLNSIILLVFEVYKVSEMFDQGLEKIEEIMEWLTAEKIKGVDQKRLSNYKAFFLNRNDKIIETEEYLLKNLEAGKKERDDNTVVVSLLNLITLYARLQKKEDAEKRIKEITDIISRTTDFPANILHKLAELFYNAQDHEREMIINEKLYGDYQRHAIVEGRAGMLVNIGTCYKKSNTLEKAETHYNEAIKISEENHLKDISYMANYNLALLLEQKKKSDSALKIYENLMAKLDPSSGGSMLYRVRKRLFFAYLRESKNSFKEKDTDKGAVFVRESMKYADELSMEDFVHGLFFDFIFPLIESHGKSVIPFFAEIDRYLVPFKNSKKGPYMKMVKITAEILKGEDINRLTKDMSILHREILGLIKEKVEKSAEGIPEFTRHSQDWEAEKLEQIKFCLQKNTPESILDAEKSLKEIDIDRLSSNRKIDFHILNIVILLLTQRKEKLKHGVSDLLVIIGNAPAKLEVESDYADLLSMMREGLSPVDWDYMCNIEAVIKNRTPVNSFLNKFTDSIDADILNELRNRLKDSGKGVLNRIVGDGFANMDEIVTLSASRLNLESVLYNIKLQYNEMPAEKQAILIPVLSSMLKELPESYKWMVLDFSSGKIVDVSPEYQAELVDSFLKLLKKQDISDYLKRETITFLQTAKFILKEELKDEIERELLKIKEEK